MTMSTSARATLGSTRAAPAANAARRAASSRFAGLVALVSVASFASVAFASVVMVGCDKSAATSNDPQTTFMAVCGRCHGAQGTGGTPIGIGGPTPRNFHDPEFQRTRTDADIVKTIREGKPPGMPAFGSTLSDEQVRGLVAIVRSFQSDGAAQH